MRTHAVAWPTAAVAAVVIVGLLSSAPAAAAAPVNVQVALDKPVQMDIADMPIGQVFQRLTQATGVSFVLAPDVYACLPYGDLTRLNVKLPNVTLRSALSPMLAPLAMQWTVDKGAVRVEPAPALVRMTRRATIEELQALGQIHSVRMEPVDKAGEVIEQLRKISGNKDLSLFYHVKTDKAEKEAAAQRADRALPCTAGVWLDVLCHAQNWTWYLWGDVLMIVDRKAQVERQLQRQVSLRYEGAQLVAVLLDLARQGHVTLNMDPGVMELVPVETRTNFNLMMADASIAQALEVLSGATGLVFVREPAGLRVEASERLKKKAQAEQPESSKRTPFFFKKSLPMPDGSTLELLLRPDDLPEEVVEAIKAERARLVEQLIRKYGSTTRPATTQPAR